MRVCMCVHCAVCVRCSVVCVQSHDICLCVFCQRCTEPSPNTKTCSSSKFSSFSLSTSTRLPFTSPSSKAGRNCSASHCTSSKFSQWKHQISVINVKRTWLPLFTEQVQWVKSQMEGEAAAPSAGKSAMLQAGVSSLCILKAPNFQNNGFRILPSYLRVKVRVCTAHVFPRSRPFILGTRQSTRTALANFNGR